MFGCGFEKPLNQEELTRPQILLERMIVYLAQGKS